MPIVLSQKETSAKDTIADGAIRVGIYGPSHGLYINRNDPHSFLPILEKAHKLNPNIKTLWAPSPVKSNAVVTRDGFKKIYQAKMPRPNGTSTWCNVFGGCYADGVLLQKNEAFCIMSADCPTVVAYGKTPKGELYASVAHAGRDSVIHRDTLRKHDHFRQHFTVVSAILSPLLNLGVPYKNMYLHIYCGIRTGFTHPSNHNKYGDDNTRLLDYCAKLERDMRCKGKIILNKKSGEIDMYALIYALASMSIPATNIRMDNIDTYTQTQWASTRRPESRASCERNIVIVSRS